MICKLVGYGKTRQEAIEKTRTALDSYVIRGKLNCIKERLQDFKYKLR